MIVVDVEATGVDARLCSLLSVGAVEFERPENEFYMECYAFPGAHIEKEALKISGFTMEEIATPSQISPLEKGERNLCASASEISVHQRLAKRTDREVVLAFLDWMKTCSEWTLAGQNPSFDRAFLEETAHRYHINWPLAHRTIDLHSVCYYHMKKRGVATPLRNNHSALNLDRIAKYVGLPTRENKHNALADAKLEAEALSRLLYGKNIVGEYAGYAIPTFLQEGISTA